MTDAVGFIGTGAIGTAMILRLLDVGHSVVVNNRTRMNAEAAVSAGAEWVDARRTVLEHCPLVLTCLRDTAATEEVYLGDGGLLGYATAGQLFVEHGTFAPALARRIATAAQEVGAEFLAAPVSGGAAGARTGSLVLMVGGGRAAFDLAKPVFDALSPSPTLVGGAAAGLELKLVNQLLTSTHMAVAGEAIGLLHKLGIDLAAAGELLPKGWAESAMLARALDIVQRGELEGTGATIRGMAEVLELVEDLLVESATRAPVFETGRSAFLEAVGRGLGEHDPAALYRMTEES
jgi:3-hydroxyisobutyrate dehydrogenase/2-hydroxy-3-oxopropionate reductase